MHFILLMMLCGWIFMVSAFTVWCNRGTTTETGACASGPSDLSCGSSIFCGLRWNADACQLLPWPGSKNVWHWWLWPIWQFKTPSGIYIYIYSLSLFLTCRIVLSGSLFSLVLFSWKWNPLLARAVTECLWLVQVDERALKLAWESSHRSTKEDWSEWMRHFSVELLKESPSCALRICAGLAQLQVCNFTSLWSRCYIKDFLSQRALDWPFLS